MAFQMNYTNNKNANYPASYWRLGWFQIDRSSRHGKIRFDCYFDAAARQNDEEFNILESKNYLVTGEAFTAAFEVGTDFRQAMYDFAYAHKEGPLPEEGQPDTRVSFFATATIV